MAMPNISSIFSDFTNAVVATNTIVPQLKQQLESLQSICTAADQSGSVFNKDGDPNGSDLINDYLNLVGTLNPAAGTPEAAQLAALQKCPAFASIYQSATAVATKVGNFGSGGSEYISFNYNGQAGTVIDGASLAMLAEHYVYNSTNAQFSLFLNGTTDPTSSEGMYAGWEDSNNNVDPSNGGPGAWADPKDGSWTPVPPGETVAYAVVNSGSFTLNGADFAGAASSMASIISQL